MQVGVLIGKAGDTIRYLQYNSRAKIQITRDADADPYSSTRAVEITGSLDSISKAEKLINAVIAEVFSAVSNLDVSCFALISIYIWRSKLHIILNSMYLLVG